jgi:hypothetical protein
MGFTARERWTSKKDVLQHQLSAARPKDSNQSLADFDEEKLAALRTLKSKRASQRGAAPFFDQAASVRVHEIIPFCAPLMRHREAKELLLAKSTNHLNW